MGSDGCLTGVHHVAVKTLDYARTMSFYSNVLELPVRLEWTAPDGRQLALLELGGGSHLEVIGYGEGTPPATGGQDHPWMHVAFATANPDVLWQKAIDAGYPSVIDPKDVQLGDLSVRLAFFEGPNGEVVELFSER